MKTSAKLVRILEQVKTSTASQVFTDLLSNSPKRSPRFSPGYEGKENMFYFLNEAIVSKTTEKLLFWKSFLLRIYEAILYLKWVTILMIWNLIIFSVQLFVLSLWLVTHRLQNWLSTQLFTRGKMNLLRIYINMRPAMSRH